MYKLIKLMLIHIHQYNTMKHLTYTMNLVHKKVNLSI